MAASGANRRRGFLPRNWAEALVAGLPIGIIAMFATNRIVFLWLGVAAFGGGLLPGSVQMLAERLRIDLKRAKVATAAWDILWYGGYTFASAGVAVLGLWIAAGKAPLKSPPLMVMVIGFAMLIEGLFVGLLIHPLEPGGKKSSRLFSTEWCRREDVRRRIRSRDSAGLHRHQLHAAAPFAINGRDLRPDSGRLQSNC